MEKKFGSGQPQLDIETKGYEYRYKYGLPADFRDRVCTCERINYTTNPTSWACGNCGKPPVHHLNRCVDCSTVFIKDFSFPWFCTICPTCYECSKNIAAPCLDHDIIPLWRNKYTTETGAPLGKPLGLNPRELTDEERNILEAEFTF